ncbi:MAG TPA: hypothetical protein VHR72_15230, partial [Gemmataceae bacterium]|nr:hypothetical protein [Gemmataceae bacterium]
TLFMTALLAVPAPDAKDNAPLPAPTGPAPRLTFAKADANGKIICTVRRLNTGGPARSAIGMSKIELKDVKDLIITTPDGKKIDLADAEKKIAGGAYVVLPADGRAISPGYLRMFRPDVIVLTSPELINIVSGANIGGGVRIGVNGGILPIVPAPKAAPPGQ